MRWHGRALAVVCPLRPSTQAGKQAASQPGRTEGSGATVRRAAGRADGKVSERLASGHGIAPAKYSRPDQITSGMLGVCANGEDTCSRQHADGRAGGARAGRQEARRAGGIAGEREDGRAVSRPIPAVRIKRHRVYREGGVNERDVQQTSQQPVGRPCVDGQADKMVGSTDKGGRADERTGGRTRELAGGCCANTPVPGRNTPARIEWHLAHRGWRLG